MKYTINPWWFVASLVLGGLAWWVFEDFSVGIAVFAAFLMPALIKLYIPYAKDNPKKLWFKRKVFGWGWTPVTWQGWLISILYIGLIVLFALTIDQTSPPREVVFTFFLPVLILTVTFIRIAYKKGERPRWQWGRDKEEDIRE